MPCRHANVQSLCVCLVKSSALELSLFSNFDLESPDGTKIQLKSSYSTKFSTVVDLQDLIGNHQILMKIEGL